MRVLFIGDVVGKPGRRALGALLPAWRIDSGYDAVIVNGENAAGGFGLTPSVAKELFTAGADIITLGNHAFANREVVPLLESEPRVIRPANYPKGAPGRGSAKITAAGGEEIYVLNLLGRIFLEPLDDPFALAQRILPQLRETTPYIIVDFHAEATSEKVAFGWAVDGLVSAVVGTHTHVQTADERILPGGTGYITDVGMSGPVEGVLGVDREIVLRKFRTQLPVRFSVAPGPVVVSALSLDIDSSGKAVGIERIQLKEGDDRRGR